jgi:hypothetical protein
MRKLRINRVDFESAFELSSYEMNAYLNTETGAVVYVEDDTSRQLEELLTDEETLEAALATIQAQPDLDDSTRAQLMDAARVEWEFEGHYTAIPKQDSREGYRDMEEFIWSLDNDHLREVLEVAIQGRGAFRRFKDVLYRHPDTEAEWFVFRDARERNRMIDWLASIDIEPEFE